MTTENQRPETDPVFAGSGELAQLMRWRDWTTTPLGPPEHWPQSLRTVVRILLTSRYAMWMGWGPELTFFYNDAYAPTLGTKHPWALGASATEVWAEIWPDIGPRIESVLRTGEATWDEGLLLFLERRGFREETYHTFSYSPLPTDAGGTGGMLCVVTEETDRVIGARRISLLKELAAQLAATKSSDGVVEALERSLASDSRDLPFSLTYVAEGETLRLRGQTGLAIGHPSAPATLDPLSPDCPWLLKRLWSDGQPQELQRLSAERKWPAAPLQWPVSEALLLPIAQQGQARPAGFFIAGLNPHRPLDEEYRDFLRLFVGQISAGLANAQAYEVERKRAEALAEIDRAKTAFFSNVSHEFRTPLTLILGPLGDLLQGRHGALDPQQRTALELLHRNALRLLKLVNALLDVSRLEAGRTHARRERTDLAEITADLASSFRSAVERVGLALRVDCPPLSQPVAVDRGMWEKIVLNLLSNAFKFTFEGSIDVRLAEVDRRAVLTVTDTGTGIPPEELPKIFERFHRIEGARGRTHEGSGIGLALVHELVKLHGGTVRATSEVGRGSSFVIELPLDGMEDITSTPPPVRESRGTGQALEAFVMEAQRWAPDEVQPDVPPSFPPTAALKRARLVLADDNADMREYVYRLLAGRYDVVPCANGALALEQIRQHRPDLVLTDVMMPELDGFGLLQAIRADPALRALPVIMLSARSGEESRSEGLEAGADDYVVKPFSARELLARVATHLEMVQIRAEAARRERELLLETAAMKDRLEQVVRSINDAFVTFDRDLRFTFVNTRAAANFGVTPDRLLGVRLTDWDPSLEGNPGTQRLRASLESGQPDQYETFYPSLNRWFEVRLYPSPGGIALFATDITVRKDSEAQVQEALEKERQAVRYRDEFLSIASHELRTPLSSVKMQVQLTQMAAAKHGGLAGVPPARVEKLMQVVDRQVNNLDRLVSDLLDVSRVANGRLTVEREEVELSKLVRAVVDQFAEQLEAAGCPVTFTAPGELFGHWDPRRLEQVVTNLLTNAMKYAPGQPLKITLTGDTDLVRLAVKDHGAGIPQEHQARIFGRFERVSHRTGVSGLGLGLFVSKEIVEAHGGGIRLESAAGQGATFTVELPRRLVDAT